MKQMYVIMSCVAGSVRSGAGPGPGPGLREARRTLVLLVNVYRFICCDFVCVFLFCLGHCYSAAGFTQYIYRYNDILI